MKSDRTSKKFNNQDFNQNVQKSEILNDNFMPSSEFIKDHLYNVENQYKTGQKAIKNDLSQTSLMTLMPYNNEILSQSDRKTTSLDITHEELALKLHKSNKNQLIK